MIGTQIDYTWDAAKLCTKEVYTFNDYDELGVLVGSKVREVTYTWNEKKLCTGISIEEVEV